MTTREQAWADAAECFAEAELGIRRDTVAEAAARSNGVRSGRVTQSDMEARITAVRAADRAPQTPAHAAESPGRRARVTKKTA